MAWNEVLDPEKGYIKDDTIILEVSHFFFCCIDHIIHNVNQILSPNYLYFSVCLCTFIIIVVIKWIYFYFFIVKNKIFPYFVKAM